jgi:hypothetical protein
MVGLVAIAVGIFMFVGFAASLLDPSTAAERACITKQAAEFYQCVIDTRRGRP